jgi:hypothetical protein
VGQLVDVVPGAARASMMSTRRLGGGARGCVVRAAGGRGRGQARVQLVGEHLVAARRRVEGERRTERGIQLERRWARLQLGQPGA